jgi:hypothetical protein
MTIEPPKEAEGNQKSPLGGYFISRHKFDSTPCRIWCRIVNHSTRIAMASNKLFVVCKMCFTYHVSRRVVTAAAHLVRVPSSVVLRVKRDDSVGFSSRCMNVGTLLYSVRFFVVTRNSHINLEMPRQHSRLVFLGYLIRTISGLPRILAKIDFPFSLSLSLSRRMQR